MQEIEAPEQLPRYRWVVISIWLMCGNIGSTMTFTIGILLPSISADLDLSPSQQGLLGSASFWAGLTLGIPVSWFLSRFRPKALGIVALTLAGLFLMVQGLAANFAVLIVGRLGLGLSPLIRDPARSLLINMWFRPREFLLITGLAHTMWGIFVGGGMLATPYILDLVDDDWRTVLLTFAAAFAVLTLLWTILGRERATPDGSRDPARKAPGVSMRVLTHRDLWLNGAGVFGSILSLSAFFTFLPTLMLETYDISLKWSGAALGVGTVIGGLAGGVIGYVATAIGGRNRIMQVLGILMAGTYMGLTQANSVPLLMLMAVLNGAAWGCWPIVSVVPFHLPRVGPREIAVALAFTTTMLSLGTVVGPVMTGVLQEATGDLEKALFVASFGALLLTFAGTFLRIGRTEARSSTKAAA